MSKNLGLSKEEVKKIIEEEFDKNGLSLAEIRDVVIEATSKVIEENNKKLFNDINDVIREHNNEQHK